MVKSNAQRQAEYQRRQQEAGSYRLDAYISPDAHAALQQVVQRDGISRKDAIEQSILNEAKGTSNMQTQFRMDDPATDGKPVLAKIRLTASELAPRKPVSQPATRKDVSPMTTNQTPARPSQLTAGEAADLERFKEQLPNAIINHEQNVKAHAFNGGDDGARRKAAFNAALAQSNPHHK